MFRNLFVFIFLSLCGCLVYVPTDDNTSGGSPIYSDLWIENAYVECQYDAGAYPSPKSYWYFQAYIDSSYGHYDSEVEVGFYIQGQQWLGMLPAGGNLWTQSYDSFYWSCYDSFYFDFEASDIYWNWSVVTVWW